MSLASNALDSPFAALQPDLTKSSSSVSIQQLGCTCKLPFSYGTSRLICCSCHQLANCNQCLMADYRIKQDRWLKQAAQDAEWAKAKRERDPDWLTGNPLLRPDAYQCQRCLRRQHNKVEIDLT